MRQLSSSVHENMSISSRNICDLLTFQEEKDTLSVMNRECYKCLGK